MQGNMNDVVLVLVLLTLNRFHTLFWCFHDWLWTSKCGPREKQLFAIPDYSWLFDYLARYNFERTSLSTHFSPVLHVIWKAVIWFAVLPEILGRCLLWFLLIKILEILLWSDKKDVTIWLAENLTLAGLELYNIYIAFWGSRKHSSKFNSCSAEVDIMARHRTLSGRKCQLSDHILLLLDVLSVTFSRINKILQNNFVWKYSIALKFTFRRE